MGKKSKKDYICSCYKITKCDVKEHIQNGVVKYKDLQELLKIGTKCSSCKTRTKKKFKKYRKKLST